MSIFDDFSRFLDSKLDEFLRNNPKLELQLVLEELQQQEQDTKKLISNLELEVENLRRQILAKAEDIKTWHDRITKANNANRRDLADAAAQKKAELLLQGNQLWQKMENAKNKITASEQLLIQIQEKRKEVNLKVVQNQNTNSPRTNTSSQQTSYKSSNKGDDDLEYEFRRLELQEELEQMKKNIRR